MIISEAYSKGVQCALEKCGAEDGFDELSDSVGKLKDLVKDSYSPAVKHYAGEYAAIGKHYKKKLTPAVKHYRKELSPLASSVAKNLYRDKKQK